MASANSRASSKSGDDVSHHKRSAYGAYARPRAIAAGSPPSNWKYPSLPRRKLLVLELRIRRHSPGAVARREPNTSARAAAAPRRKLKPSELAESQADLGQMGSRFQFVTLAGFHTLNLSMFQLASRYGARGMTAYAELQDEEFAARQRGYRATEHQAFV